MPSAIIYTDKEEDDKVETYSKKWELSKMETIKKMIREFEGEGED